MFDVHVSLVYTPCHSCWRTLMKWRAFLLFAFFCPSLAIAVAPTPQPFPVHMLVPGFTVRELPVQLTNINNIEYAPDGRLFAVGYDGRVHVLTDTDNDGLEDTARVYYSGKAGEIRAPVGMCIRPEGIYIASKGRISLIKDTDHDGIADVGEVVVGGWKEL